MRPPAASAAGRSWQAGSGGPSPSAQRYPAGAGCRRQRGQLPPVRRHQRAVGAQQQVDARYPAGSPPPSRRAASPARRAARGATPRSARPARLQHQAGLQVDHLGAAMPMQPDAHGGVRPAAAPGPSGARTRRRARQRRRRHGVEPGARQSRCQLRRLPPGVGRVLPVLQRAAAAGAEMRAGAGWRSGDAAGCSAIARPAVAAPDPRTARTRSPGRVSGR